MSEATGAQYNSNGNQNDPLMPDIKLDGFYVDGTGLYEIRVDKKLKLDSMYPISYTPFILTNIGESLQDSGSRMI
jgi:hypothetical protein